MQYWAILAGKLALAVPLLYGFWLGLHALYVTPEISARWNHQPFLHDLPWTTIMFVYNLVCHGVLFLIIVDQRYRCRTCGRRLRMPVTMGRYAQMLLFGPPRTEYICLYGHGTLKVPDLQISGFDTPAWQPHDDIWKELESLAEPKK